MMRINLPKILFIVIYMRTYKGGYLSGKKGRKSRDEVAKYKKEVCFKVKRGRFLISFD